jgi:hypothetical protein
MKSLTTACLFLLLARCAFAQAEPCEFYKDEIDPIEGTHDIISRSKSYAGMAFPNVWFVAKDNHLHMEIPLGMMGAAIINDGDEFVFKCDNDSLIRLHHVGSTATEYYGGGNWVGNWYANIERKDLEKFANWSIVMIRIYYDDTHKDYPVRRKGAEAIRQAAACLLQ